MKHPLDELHKKAMHLADEAFYAKRANKLEVAQQKYLEAFEYEKAAVFRGGFGAVVILLQSSERKHFHKLLWQLNHLLDNLSYFRC